MHFTVFILRTSGNRFNALEKNFSLRNCFKVLKKNYRPSFLFPFGPFSQIMEEQTREAADG